MAGDSSTTLFAGTGGDLIYDELLGSGVKMAATKLHTGALGVDGGPNSLTNPIFVQNAGASVSQGATLATGGVIIKASAGSALWAQVENTGAGAVFIQIHDLASGSPAGSARPVYYSASIPALTGTSTFNIGHGTVGIPCVNGVCLIASSTQFTYTAIAVNTVGYNIIKI